MDETQKKTICSVVDKILTPCPSLNQAITGPFVSSRKGVLWFELRNTGSGRFEVTRSGAVLRSGSLDPNGVVMNYCPFCGASIAEHFQAKGEEATP